MMRARLGIDKNNSWADWAEEEEEAAEPTKTLADAKYEVAGEVLGMRLRGGGLPYRSHGGSQCLLGQRSWSVRTRRCRHREAPKATEPS